MKSRMPRPETEDGLPLRAHEREHVPLSEERARRYPMLEGGITLGTVCEYDEDGWSWVVVTDLPPEVTWGDVADDPGEHADNPVVRFLNLEKLTDDEFTLFEDCVGCYEHVDTARLFRDHEGAGKYMRQSRFVENFTGLGPFHPEADREEIERGDEA